MTLYSGGRWVFGFSLVRGLITVLDIVLDLAIFYHNHLGPCIRPARARIIRRGEKQKEPLMTAFNAVRFRVKPGQDQAFLDAHKKLNPSWQGMRHANIIKTGDRTYCIIVEWDSMDALAKARPEMIKTLDSFRHMLEDLGGGLGLTDPVSGEVVLAMK
jgi:hypothetical protein